MKGVFFCLLEKMIVTQSGEGAWEKLLRAAPLQTTGGKFIGSENYADEEMYALVSTASALTGHSIPDLMRAYGRFLFPEMALANLQLVPPGISAKQFLLSVQSFVHAEVYKLYPETKQPHFDYEDPGPDRLVMLYHSKRNLCDLAAGLIDGVGDFLGESISQVHAKCSRHGHPHCRFELRFGAEAR